MYVYFQDSFDVSNKQYRRLIFFREKLGRMKRKLRMCVFVCVGGWGECVCYPQSPESRDWNPPFHQIDITEQCESLCKRQIIFESHLNQSCVLTVGQTEYHHNFFAYMLINPSLDVVVSLAAIPFLSR